MGQTQNAEYHLLIAYNMSPSKFYPLYKLFNLYFYSNEFGKAYNIGVKIEEKKVKVTSINIDLIKASIQEKMQILRGIPD